MRIGEYIITSVTQTGFLACRDGMLYRLKRCAPGMTLERADAVKAALNHAIQPDSNVLIPHFVNEDGIWYAAVPFRNSTYQGLPRTYLRCLPLAARKHMILLAVSAIDTLARSGFVHGSLNPDCFRIAVTDSGILCPILEDLQNIGFDSFPPLAINTKSSYTAPEVRRGETPTIASDTFSLALCLHEWLAGELPRCSGNGRDLSRESIWFSTAIPAWARGVLADMLSVDATLRPAPSEILSRLAKSNETSSVALYCCESDAEEDADMCTLMLQEDPRLVNRYS